MRCLQDFLQLGLRVLAGPVGIETVDALAEGGEHGFARGVVAAVEEYRAEERFQRVGEDRGARLGVRGELAFAELQLIGHAELAGHLRERLFAHEARAQARELALGKLRKARVELGCDGAAEYAVAEEFQPFVVLRAVTAVGQRLLEEPRARETVAEPFLEGRGDQSPPEVAW